MASAWPFLIARGRNRDYRTILAPDLLAGASGPRRLADRLPVGRPEDGQRHTAVEHAALGRLLVTSRAEVLHPSDIGAAVDDPMTDEHGRPLVFLYGLVSTARDPGVPSDGDMAKARASAMAAYQAFLADEPTFEVVPSREIQVRSAVGAPQPPPEPDPNATVHDPRRTAMPSRGRALTPQPPPASVAPPPRRPWVLLSALVIGLLVLLYVLIPEQQPPIDDLTVTADAQNSCADVVLHAGFRLAAPTTVTFWLQRHDVKMALDVRRLDEGDQTVDLPTGLALSPGDTMTLIAATADHHVASTGVEVSCG